jgi:hypothetical protein
MEATMSAMTIEAVTKEATQKAAINSRAKPILNAIMIRAMKAILKSLDSVENCTDLASSSSDSELLLSLLQQDGVRAALFEADPLAKAKIRGIRCQLELLKIDGGCFTAEQLSKQMGITKQAISRARSDGRFLGIPRGDKHYVYPVWQFTTEWKSVPGIKQIKQIFKNPWMAASFLLSPNDWLGGKTPLDCLKRGDEAAVLNAASSYGEHGAV